MSAFGAFVVEGRGLVVVRCGTGGVGRGGVVVGSGLAVVGRGLVVVGRDQLVVGEEARVVVVVDGEEPSSLHCADAGQSQASLPLFQ